MRREKRTVLVGYFGLYGSLRYTVELQWLEHLWNRENMFESGVVRANECYSLRQVRRQNRGSFALTGLYIVCSH